MKKYQTPNRNLVKMTSILFLCFSVSVEIHAQFQITENKDLEELAQGKKLNAYEIEYGVIFTINEEMASFLTKQLTQAASNFEEAFQSVVGKHYLFDGPAMEADFQTKLMNLGYEFGLPWPASFIYKSELAQNKIDNLTDEKSHNYAIGHELGHLYLINEIYKGSNGSYGSIAPDWLDEAAALMHNNAYSKKALLSELRPEKSLSVHELIQKQHPLPNNSEIRKRVNEARQTGISGAINVRIDNKKTATETRMFYMNVLSFIEFLRFKTGSYKVIGEIAGADEQGIAFEKWLKKNGEKFGLPVTIDELDRLWVVYKLEN